MNPMICQQILFEFFIFGFLVKIRPQRLIFLLSLLCSKLLLYIEIVSDSIGLFIAAIFCKFAIFLLFCYQMKFLLGQNLMGSHWNCLKFCQWSSPHLIHLKWFCPQFLLKPLLRYEFVVDTKTWNLMQWCQKRVVANVKTDQKPHIYDQNRQKLCIHDLESELMSDLGKNCSVYEWSQKMNQNELEKNLGSKYLVKIQGYTNFCGCCVDSIIRFLSKPHFWWSIEFHCDQFVVKKRYRRS